MFTFRSSMLSALIALLAHDAHAQHSAGGMQLPDTAHLPQATLEPWKGLPEGYELPASVDLSPWFPPAGDQGRQWSCVSWALSYGIMTYRQNLWDHRTYRPGDPVDSAHTFSPAFLYNMITSFYRDARKKPDPQTCLNGLDPEKAMDIAMIGGCCTLNQLPYDTALVSCCDLPPFATLMKAIPNHIPPALILENFEPDQWRYHLAQGQPILAGIAMTTVLEDSGYAANGTRRITWGVLPHGRVLFGHEVVCTGYHDSTFTFLNSWGPNWGLHGYFDATVGRLNLSCADGYVLSNDSAATWAKTPGKPADKDTLKGPVVQENFDPGEFQEINGRKVKLATLGGGDRTAVMQVFDAGTDSLMRNVTMQAGQPFAIYEKGQRIELTYKRRSTVSRLLGLPVKFTMRTDPANDAYIRERNARIGKLMIELPK